MTFDRRRYGRQIRLSEIGEAGQARLCAAEVALDGEGLARTIAERYARGAGIRVASAAEASRAPDVTALGLRHRPAREVATGALHALVLIHAALATSEGGDR